MIHWDPVADSDRSFCRFGIAIATIVWSMNVIATANTIAARTRFLFEAPVISKPHGELTSAAHHDTPSR